MEMGIMWDEKICKFLGGLLGIRVVCCVDKLQMNVLPTQIAFNLIRYSIQSRTLYETFVLSEMYVFDWWKCPCHHTEKHILQNCN